jgi:hypothetical protein
VSGAATLARTGTINSTKTLTVNDGVLAPGTTSRHFQHGERDLKRYLDLRVEIGGITPGNLASNYDQLNVTVRSVSAMPRSVSHR